MAADILKEGWDQKVIVPMLVNRLRSETDDYVFGRIDDMSQLYSEAHATVLVARETVRAKPLPNSLVESCACGRPVVTSSVCGLAPLLTETDAGKVIEPDADEMAAALESGAHDFDELESNASDALREAGFAPEYVSIRRAESLDVPDRETDELVILAAARLGKARLIDNVVVHV